MPSSFHPPDSILIRDIAYQATDDPKRKLDLYRPSQSTRSPVLIFIHGGGWTEGDKNLDVDGYRLYEDVGKTFSRTGFLTAVINYRLIPKVSWKEQLRDVTAAVRWVHQNAASYGGDASRLYLTGHSAGSQLAARVAFDPELLGGEKIISGILAVSGAGYQIEKRLSYYAKRFQENPQDDQWPKEASLLRFVSKDSPPFLIVYGSKEPRDFREQAQKLKEACETQGVAAKLVEIPGQDHFGMAVDMGRPDSPTVSAMLDFLR